MKKIVILVLIILLFFVKIAEAQTHPHLFFDSSTIPLIRAKALDTSINKLGFSSKTVWDKIISNAQTYFENQTYYIILPGDGPWAYNISDPLEFPPSHSAKTNYPVWTGLSRTIESMFKALSLAYIATDNITYAQKLKNFTISLANWNKWTDPEYPDLVNPAKVSLDTAHLSIAMALAYDTVYNMLNDSEKNLVRNAIIDKGIIPLNNSVYEMTQAAYDYIPGKKFQYTPNNWTYHNLFALYNSGLGLASVSIIDEDPRTESWINYSADSIITFFGANWNSGSTIEGQEYGSYSMDNLMMLIEALRFNNIRDLYNNQFVQNIYKFPLYFLSSDGKTIANFGDSSYGIGEGWTITMPLIASRLNNPYAQWYLAKTKILETTNINTMMGNLWYDNTVTPINPEGNLPSSFSFDYSGHAALRTGWNEGEWLLAFKSGNWIPYSHLHYDQNSFSINLGNDWVLTDPGYGYSATVGHSTILVDGNNQNSTDGTAGNMSGNIEKFFTSDYYDYILGEAANAYSNYSVTQFSRNVLFIKPKYFLVLDDIKSSIPHQYDFLLHTDNSGYMFGDLNDFFIRKYDDQILIKQFSSSGLTSSILLYPGAESYGPYLDTKNQVNQNNIKLLTFLYPEKIFGMNLLINSDFENYTSSSGIGDNWNGRSTGCVGCYDGTYSIDETIFHKGNRSQKLSSTTSGTSGYVYQRFRVRPEINYTVASWIKTDSVEYSAYIQLWYFNSSGGFVGGANSITLTGTNDWTIVSFNTTTPSQAAEVTVAFAVWGSGTAWFDDTSFKEVTEESYTLPVIEFNPIYYNGDITGGIINYENTTDAVIISSENTLNDYQTSIGNITSDSLLSILRNPIKIESFAIQNGTKFYYNNSLIFESQKNATAVFEKIGNNFNGFVNSLLPNTVKIYSERSVYSVNLNNEEGTFSYDSKNKVLTFNLNEPSSEVNIQCEGECNKILKPNEMAAIKITAPPSMNICDKELKMNVGGIERTVRIRC